VHLSAHTEAEGAARGWAFGDAAPGPNPEIDRAIPPAPPLRSVGVPADPGAAGADAAAAAAAAAVEGVDRELSGGRPP